MWPFDIAKKRDRRSNLDTVEAWEEWQKPLYIQGYLQWCYQPPMPGQWIEATRREWATNHVWKAGTEAPWMNTADLWWRPWRGETYAPMQRRAEMSEMIYSAFGKNIEDLTRDELIKALKVAMDQVKHLERVKRSAVGV